MCVTDNPFILFLLFSSPCTSFKEGISFLSKTSKNKPRDVSSKAKTLPVQKYKKRTTNKKKNQ